VSPDKGRSSRKAPPQPPTTSPDPLDSTWTIRPASEQARKQWDSASAAEPDPMAGERERLRNRPLDRSANPRRTGQLKGSLATTKVADATLPQWQQELTAAGRLWYCPDKETRTVWITRVDLRHPKTTD
jgi:hypothetical protein